VSPAAGARHHWPEYLAEALGLGLFMVSACGFAVLLFHPDSRVAAGMIDPILRRLLMGCAMGATAVALIYSPWGRRSGAHLNPATTLAFMRLGKVAPEDALFYVLAQFAGATLATVLLGVRFGAWMSDPAVHWVVTRPGPAGLLAAAAAELGISCGLMLVVLTVSNTPRVARWTGVSAGVMVAAYITLESPISGMSMNPARTFASAFAARDWTALWIYFLMPPAGMLLGSQLYLRWRGRRRVFCAKLQHDSGSPCIFCDWRSHRSDRTGALERTRIDARSAGTAGLAAHSDSESGPARPPGTHREEERATLQTRARLLAALTVGGLLLSLAGAGVAETRRTPAVRAVAAVGITVSDLDRCVDFYTNVLAFTRLDEFEATGTDLEHLEGVFGAHVRQARLRLGDETLDLTQYLAPEGRPFPTDSRSNDRWFQHVAIVVSDMDRAYETLRAHRVRYASTEPQRLPDWNHNAAGIRAFYFKDPEGHTLEIIWFPPGKGDPKWQGRTDRLFLGIDHTAIVVEDTDASLAFYRDGLGLRVAGESMNYGTEQEHLNNVFGARLRITALRAAQGPGIELLEYLAPRDGRPIPADERANDLVHWQTTLTVRDLDATVRDLSAQRARLVSSGPVEVQHPEFGFRAGCLVRDPDGHVMQLIGGAEAGDDRDAKRRR
jgi:catechol 2,3-dioxygenase-like lactoylglutathione lyase family enzyme/glycerol uptake facilitator-like aquaporin